MELTKQGQPPRVSGSAGTPPPQPPLPSAVHQSAAQLAYPAVFYPDNWGARVPISSYLIVPMNQQPVQVGVPRPSAPHLSGAARPLSRVSLRPPQQVLSVQTSFPGVVASQPSPPLVGKKTAVSPKVQMLKSMPSQLSTGKHFVQKELPPKAHPHLFESVRSKFRETLAAALSMDCDQQSGQQSAGNVSPVGSACENKQADGDTLQGPITKTSQEAGIADTDNVPKVAAIRSKHNDMLCSNLKSNMTIKVSDDMQQQSIHVPLENEVLGNGAVALDELLQGHGLYWASDIVVGSSESMSEPNSKRVRISDVDAGFNVSQIEPESKRTKTADEATEEKDRIQKAQSLAFRIEEELFKLFGGVNKKYKEKGRSLLFNLKDKSNPVLRERVLSGDITPNCLCAMTIEELASKELSEWRVAKAEELAKMVVLPDREVDVRRLVRKTHKGEFQVEVEDADGISVEVGLGADLLSHVPSRPIDDQTKSDDRTSAHREDKEADNTVQEGVARTCNSNSLNNLECPATEKTDLMQELMVDDLNVRENLPQIMSLDEFMEVLDSEPKFEHQSTETMQDDPSSIDKADNALKSEKIPIAEDKAAAPEFQFDSDAPSAQDNSLSKLESPNNESVSNLDRVKEPIGDVLVKSPPEKVDDEKPDTVSGSMPESTLQITPDAVLTHDSIWEGTIQLTLSSLTNIVAIFKSGEKPSTNEWRRFVEIKGRVRLSAFEEFLEQLPKSRSRAIMVIELRWKEGSLESGRQHLLQTIDSYNADERVGLVNPAEGVELYLCPSQGRTAQILADHLSKEHSDSLTVAGTSFIGVVVWRRPSVSPRIPNKQDGSKRQSIAWKPQAMILSSVPMSSQPSSRSSNARCHHQDIVTDDVPPGFGPGVVRDDDDLPEYDFVSIAKAAANVTTPQAYRSQQHLPATSLPMDQVREMVRKYGNRSVAAHPWNGNGNDDDDIPEWNPNQSNLQQTRHAQQQLPPPLSVQQVHHYHQQQQYRSMLQYHIIQESQSPLPQAYGQPQHNAMPAQQPLTYGHHMQPAQTQSGQLNRQTNAQWLAAAAPPETTALAQNAAQQSYFGVVPDVAWKPQ